MNDMSLKWSSPSYFVIYYYFSPLFCRRIIEKWNKKFELIPNLISVFKNQISRKEIKFRSLLFDIWEKKKMCFVETSVRISTRSEYVPNVKPTNIMVKTWNQIHYELKPSEILNGIEGHPAYTYSGHLVDISVVYYSYLEICYKDSVI